MTAARGTSCEAGFSLIEVMTVLFIIALATIIVAPSLRGSSGKSNMLVFRAELAALVSYQRTRAMNSSTERSLTIDASRREVASDDGRLMALPADVAVQIRGAPGDMSAAATPVRIRFFPDGSSTGAVISLMWQTERAELTIDWMTGTVSLDRKQ